MALYTIREGDRLDRLAARQYAVADDDAIMSIIRANQATWTGRLPSVGTVIDLPDDILPGLVGTRIPSPVVATDAPTPTGSRSVDINNGTFLSNDDAIRQAVLTRVRTIRGSRWFAPSFGSLAVILGLSASVPDDFEAEVTAAITNALAEDDDWYDVIGIAFRDVLTGDIGEAPGVHVTIRVVARVDGTPIQVEVTV